MGQVGNLPPIVNATQADLQEREQKDWAYFGRLRSQLEKKLADPQDVLMEADRLRAQQKRHTAQKRRDLQK